MSGLDQGGLGPEDQKKVEAAHQEAPESDVLKRIALEMEQERDRRAAYTRDEEKRQSEAKAQALADAKELLEFLRCIAYGEQDKAEAMLKARPSIALRKGVLCDPSGREFKEITGFQYALWALDWHMWRMLLKYMDKEAAAIQFAELDSIGTVHGKHFSLAPLLEALNSYVSQYHDRVCRGAWREIGNHWCQQVGREQLLLPMHVVNEYCHPTRSFLPCPGFTEGVLPRNTKVFVLGEQGSWFTENWFAVTYKGEKLGEKFGIVRYSMDAMAGARVVSVGRECESITDAEAIQKLWEMRQLQLKDLQTELQASSSQLFSLSFNSK